MFHGTSHRGWIEGVDGELVATRFFHIWWLPLVPLRSLWVIGSQGSHMLGHPRRLSGPSVVAGYARVWGPIATIAGAATTSLAGGMVAVAAAVLTAWTWCLRWPRDRRERQRAALQRPVVGTACDPLRLPRVLAARLRPLAEERFAEVSDGRTPLDVARFGASSSAQAAHAFVVLRLMAASGRGASMRDALVASERVLDGSRDLDADAVGGPYRAPTVGAPATGASAAPVVLVPSGPVAASSLGGFWTTCGLSAVALAVAGYVLLVTQPFGCFCASRSGVAHAQVGKLAYEAFPQWAQRPGNVGRCPTLADLSEYAYALEDPWGQAYRLACDDLPAGATGIAIWSIGENRCDERGAGDDLTSWELPQ